MIKFFRKIRYNLMEQNKTGKYLKYAIGEIILVVIGILIAISINNWNEEKKERIIEHNYLLRLLKDLEDDKKTLIFSKGLSESRLAQINLLSNAIENPNTLSENGYQIIQSIEKITWRSYLYLSRIVYNELLNSGNMSLIKSEKLREHLANYYSDADNWEITLNIDESQKEFSQATAGLLSVKILTAIENSESTTIGKSIQNVDLDIEDMEIMKIVQELSSNHEAIKWLPQLHHHHVLANKIIIHLIEKNEVLKNLIYLELKNIRF